MARYWDTRVPARCKPVHRHIGTPTRTQSGVSGRNCIQAKMDRCQAIRESCRTIGQEWIRTVFATSPTINSVLIPRFPLLVMQNFPSSPKEIFASLWRNRSLIVQMTKRDVLGRYRGSIMGLGWSLFHPLVMLAIYTFVFSVVFRARWPGMAEGSTADFALLLFVGMILHALFSECVNRAPSLILSNPNYVKKVVFPLEILPCVAMGS